MEKGYPGGDFMRVRPFGSAGDRKNDGYLRSRRTLFQVYAPSEMRESEAVQKIKEDFHGAFPYWREHFDHWVFVHNDQKGLGPGITKTLLDLDKEQEGVDVRAWGFNELREEVFRLRDEDVGALLGPAPSPKDFAQLGFDKLRVVLLAIAPLDFLPEPDLSPVPREKVEINRLSRNTEILIQAGRRKSLLVGDFFARFPDPQYGDGVVERFQAKYQELRAEGREPDQIFADLMIFAGGDRVADTGHQAAVLAVLAYLFDQCDIFERAAEGVAT